MPDTLASARRFGAVLLALAGTLLTGCRTDAASVIAAPPSVGSLNAAEVRYVADTGRAIYRGRTFERSRGFVSAESASGYAVCLRAPIPGGRFDHTLLILQRRIDGAVSQVEDDATILRAAADVGACRNRTDWVPAR